MTRARDIANLVDANGDVVSDALDNAPTPTLSSLSIDNHDDITVDASGNVGIGTASPDGKLNVSVSSGDAAKIWMNNSGQCLQLKQSSANPLILRMINGSGYFYDIQNNTSDNSLSFDFNDSERCRIHSSGAFLTGKTSDDRSLAGCLLYPSGEGAFTRSNSNPLYLRRLATEGAIAQFYNNTNTNTGSISVGGSSTAYNTSSDYRLKTDVQPMTGATERLKALKPVNFQWINTGERVDGFIAHEAAEVVPEAVHGTKDAVQVWEEGEELPEGVAVGDNKLDEDGNTIPDYQGIDQSKLVPLLVATIQELEARITALEAE